ncbi:hypothetical protein Ancab_023553 [Ancistrocladus abbreviatus]
MRAVGEIGDDGGSVNDQAFEAQPLTVSSFYIYASLLLHLRLSPPIDLSSVHLSPVRIIFKAGEIRINPDWRVGTGMDSKEVEVQRSRTRREKDSVHQTAQDIPSNPKEPWDVEMDYNDSLTLPEGATSEATPATSSQPRSSSYPPEPGLELLAVLLKNPDLVFALKLPNPAPLRDIYLVLIYIPQVVYSKEG